MNPPDNSEFAHLHVHTEFSLLDGLGSVQSIVETTAERGHPFLALTEHGNMASCVRLVEECKKLGEQLPVYPIHGCEFYIVEDASHKGISDEQINLIKERTGLTRMSEVRKYFDEYGEKRGSRHRNHIVCFAKNKAGLRNLFELVWHSWKVGYYVKPRIDYKALAQHREGLVVLTACTSGIMAELLVDGDWDRAKAYLVRFKEIFGEDFYVEIQPNDLYDQLVFNRAVIQLVDETNDMMKWGSPIRLVATNDVHYPNAEDAVTQEVLLCINTHDVWSNASRFRFDSQQFWMKTAREMWDGFTKPQRFIQQYGKPADIPAVAHVGQDGFTMGHLTEEHVRQAMLSTVEIGEKCRDGMMHLDRFRCLLPSLEQIVGKDEAAGIFSEITEGEVLKVLTDRRFGWDDDDCDELDLGQFEQQKADVLYAMKLLREGWGFRQMEDRLDRRAQATGVAREELLRQYLRRLMYRELNRIINLNFVRYFLMVWDLYRYARGVNMLVGPGRGSAAASMMNYLLGITSLDPIEHGLLFERFLSADRIDMPDIDMDFPDDQCGELFDYLANKYGEDCVSQIGSYITMKGKLVLWDVSRVFEVAQNETGPVAKLIIQRSGGDERASMTLTDSFTEFERCRQFNEAHPEVLPHAKKLEGQVKAFGAHAAGVLVSPEPFYTLMPMEYREVTGVARPVSSIDHWDAQEVGLLKLDILKLRTLSIIRDALRSIESRHGVALDMERMSLDDDKAHQVLKEFCDGNTAATFQFDTHGARSVLAEIHQLNSFSELVALNALNRPGTMRSGLQTVYAQRKNEHEAMLGHIREAEGSADVAQDGDYLAKKQKADGLRAKLVAMEQDWKLHPLYDALVEETYGIMLYQEQIIKAFVDLADYPLATADSLRKAIAKSHGVQELDSEREKFVEGAVSKGIDKKDANKLFENIVFFGSYGFNQSHSAVYTLIGFWTMWLKIFYPQEYMCAVLSHEGDKGRVTAFLREVRRLNMEVLSLDINLSEAGFVPEGDKFIRCGFAPLAQCGERTVGELCGPKAGGEPYKDFFDFLKRVNRRVIHKGVIHNLVQAGAFECFVKNSMQLSVQLDAVLKSPKRERWQPEFEAWDALPKTAENWYMDEEDIDRRVSVYPISEVRSRLRFYGDFLGALAPHVFNKIVHPGEVAWDEIEADTKRSLSKERLNDCYYLGQLVEVRYQRVGDFMTHDPTDAEKVEMAAKGRPHGARYSDCNLADDSGIGAVRIFPEIFEPHRHIIDRGAGTLVLCRGHIYTQYRTFYAHSLADVRETWQLYKQNGLDGLDRFQRYLFHHPLAEAVRTNGEDRKLIDWVVAQYPDEVFTVEQLKKDMKRLKSKSFRGRYHESGIAGHVVNIMVRTVRKRTSKYVGMLMGIVTLEGETGETVTLSVLPETFVPKALIQRFDSMGGPIPITEEQRQQRPLWMGNDVVIRVAAQLDERTKNNAIVCWFRSACVGIREMLQLEPGTSGPEC